MTVVANRAGICALALTLAFSGKTLAETKEDAKPADEGEQSEALEQARYEKITDFLLSEYARIGQSNDWLTRSLVAISTSRLPQSHANRALLKTVKEDPSAVVQLVAWECLLARAKTIDPEQFEVWIGLTQKLADKNVFNGRLRVDLLRVLAIYPPDSVSKRIFGKIFEETDSLRAIDLPVIEELGRTLAAWKSPDLARALLEKMNKLNDAYRAELVLKTAGCPVAWAGNRSDEGCDPMWAAAKKDYAAWWKDDRENWKEKTAKPEGAPWRELTSSFLTVNMFDREAVKANNPEVRRDLELGSPGLKKFDVGFVVDATESMEPPLDWLRNDLRKMMTILGMLSSQPRISLTFYRDRGPYEFVATTVPLTKNVDVLLKKLNKIKALGGGDIPEAVKEGLADSFKKAGWDVKQSADDPQVATAVSKNDGKKGGAEDDKEKETDPRETKPPTPAAPTSDQNLDRKVMVLIGDAPPHPGTEDACIAMARKGAGQGFKVYAAKLATPLAETGGNLPSFDAIAAAGNGASFLVEFAAQGSFEFRGNMPHKDANTRFILIAKGSDKSGPSKELLSRILVDAVNPKYRERIEMLVPLLLEVCEQNSPEKREGFGPAPEPRKPETGPAQEQKPTPKRQQK